MSIQLAHTVWRYVLPLSLARQLEAARQFSRTRVRGAGFCFTFYNSQVQEQRKALIERVNLQLKELYGPLLACVTATKSSFDAMVRQHSPDGTRQGLQTAIQASPDGSVARAYRQWMTSVLQPLNERAAGELTVGDPSCCLLFFKTMGSHARSPSHLPQASCKEG